MSVPLVMGHRGFKEDPMIMENTLPAFNKAVETGAVDIIETDVQMTKDGVLVINHDQSTGRIYKEEHLVSEMTLKQLQGLRLKQGSGADTGVKMMTVEEFVHWLLYVNTDTSLQVIFDFKKTLDSVVFAKFHSILQSFSVGESGAGKKWWFDRVYLGVWGQEHLEYGYVYSGMFHEYKIVNISLSLNVSAVLGKWLEQRGLPPFAAVSVNFIGTWIDGETAQRAVREMFHKDTKLVVWTVNTIEQWELTRKYAAETGWDVLAICTDSPVMFKRYLDTSATAADSKGEGKELFSGKPMPFWKVTTYKSVYSTVMFMLFNKWCQVNLVPQRIGVLTVSSLFIGFLRMVHFI